MFVACGLKGSQRTVAVRTLRTTRMGVVDCGRMLADVSDRTSLYHISTELRTNPFGGFADGSASTTALAMTSDTNRAGFHP